MRKIVYFCKMISKAKLKEISAYKLQKNCEIEQVFVVEGGKMCSEALSEGMSIRVICATQSWMEQEAQAIGAMTLGTQIYEVSDSELERISGQRTPNQVWMLLDRPKSIKKHGNNSGMTLVLDRLQDPGNMGTIIRTADWFGIRRIVCSKDTVSCYNPKVVQSTMGGIFRTEITYEDLLQFLPNAKQEGRTIYGALLNGKPIYEAQIKAENTILIIGNESKGISPEVQALVDQRILIPNMGGTCESLNAGVAAAILCSEILRPR